MRFGAPLPPFKSPKEWVSLNNALGYNAAYAPVDENAEASLIDEYVAAARENDIVIAEVGAWSNIIAEDKAVKNAAIELNIRRLALAEQLGARCCVNISGSKGKRWDAADAGNYKAATYEEIVKTVQYIIDQVKPQKTFYTLEAMQWAFPDSVACYEALLHDIDRPGFAVHLDPVNLVTSPDKYYNTGELVGFAFARLGAKIRSCHAKDVLLAPDYLVHLTEVPMGQGGFDYDAYLTQLSHYPEVPLMLEHLGSQLEYVEAADCVRKTARSLGLDFPERYEKG